MSVSYSLRAKHLLSGVKPPWLAADPVGGSGEWAEEMGMCWTLCQVAKPVPCRLHCTGINVGILCFFLFLPSVTLVITGEMYFCTQLVSQHAEGRVEVHNPGSSAFFAVLYSQTFNIEYLVLASFTFPNDCLAPTQPWALHSSRVAELLMVLHCKRAP